MVRLLIFVTNCALLLLLLIGLPAATRGQLGNLQISSADTNQRLMFLGLGIAAAVNVFMALALTKVHQHKILCWQWAVVFGALLLAYYAFVQGYFDFLWLRKALRWLQNRF